MPKEKVILFFVDSQSMMRDYLRDGKYGMNRCDYRFLLFRAELLKRENLSQKVELVNFISGTHFIPYLKIIERIKPIALGFSCFCWNFRDTIEIVKVCKKMYPHIKIVLGGPEVAGQHENVLTTIPEVDFIIRGEAEKSFIDLIETLSLSKNNWEDINGLSYRGENGELKFNAIRLLADVNEIKSAFLNADEAIMETAEEVVFETFRGCPYGCAYCFWSKNKRGLSFFDLKRLEEECKIIFKYRNIRNIWLVDSNFTLDMERAKAVLRLVAKYNKHNTSIGFFVDQQLDNLDSEFLRLSESAGIRSLAIGVQSFNPEALRNVSRKFQSVEKIRNLCNFIKENSPSLSVGLQLIIGLPGDNFEKFKAGLDIAFSLPVDIIQVFSLVLISGSKLYEERDKFNFITAKDGSGKEGYVIQNNTYSFADILRTEHYLHVLRYLSPYLVLLLHLTSKELNIKISQLIEPFIVFMENNKQNRDTFLKSRRAAVEHRNIAFSKKQSANFMLEVGKNCEDFLNETFFRGQKKYRFYIQGIEYVLRKHKAFLDFFTNKKKRFLHNSPILRQFVRIEECHLKTNNIVLKEFTYDFARINFSSFDDVGKFTLLLNFGASQELLLTPQVIPPEEKILKNSLHILYPDFKRRDIGELKFKDVQYIKHVLKLCRRSISYSKLLKHLNKAYPAKKNIATIRQLILKNIILLEYN